VSGFLITGASGFLGKHLVKEILHETDYSLFLVEHTKSLITLKEKYPTRIELVGCSYDELRFHFVSKEVEGVIHCATNYGRTSMNIADVLPANLTLPVQLLELLREFGGGFFLNVDSFFNKESNHYLSLLNYSLSKRALKSWFPTFTEDILIVNAVLEHIYGPGDSESKFVPYVLKTMLENSQNRLALTMGEQKRDFIFIDDVVSALLLILKNSKKNNGFSEFEVGTGNAISIREFIALAAVTTKTRVIPEFGALPMGKYEILDSRANLTALRNLGWEPKTSIRNGLGVCVDYLLYSL
jgi:nucleoside-diphosphate-sugar epimerase